MSSLHNSIKYGTDLLRGYSRIVGLDEMEEGVSRLSETLNPILDAFARPEYARLIGRLPLIERVTGLAAGGAGFRSQISVENPAGSHVLSLVEEIWINGDGASQRLDLALSFTTLGGTDVGFAGRDTRPQINTLTGQVPHRTQLQTRNNAALAGTVATIAGLQFETNSHHRYPLMMTLAPGSSIRIFPPADNTAINPVITVFALEMRSLPGDV